MRARFEYIGTVGAGRFQTNKKGKRAYYFSLCSQWYVRGKRRVDWNNNLTLPVRLAEKGATLFQMGTLVYVTGFILSFKRKDYQENRFIVDDYYILKTPNDEREFHRQRYGDMPPEEFYDTFEESTDQLIGITNPLRTNYKDDNFFTNME